MPKIPQEQITRTKESQETIIIIVDYGDEWDEFLPKYVVNIHREILRQ